MAFQKLIAALMAGNSVILRPSPLTPISSLAFGTAAEAAGLPAGRAERGRRARRGRRRAAHHRPGRGHGVVHRLDRGRPADPRPGGTDREARRPGARRQVGADLPCPTRCTASPAGAAQVVAMTAGQACVAATRMLVPQDQQGRGARGGERRLRRHHGRPAHRPGRHDGSADHRRPARALRALRRAGRGERGKGRRRGREAGRSRPWVLLRTDRARPSRQRESGRRRRRSSVPSSR